MTGNKISPKNIESVKSIPDKIILHDARFKVHIGITKNEQKNSQEISMDIELYTNIKNAAITDSITRTINYEEVHTLIKNYVETHKHKLIETIAENIATLLLQQFPCLQVRIIIKKPQALQHKNVTYCAVDITRIHH